jgi:Tfp pilus assembly protein PilF
MAAGILVGCAVGCGGPSSVPPASPEAPLASEAAGRAPSSASGVDGPSAPASSDDVKRAISALKSRDLEGARVALESAIKRDPKHADAHHYLGVVQEQSGRKAEAEASYRRALALQPDLEESVLNLAALLIESSNAEEAALIVKRALKKFPKNAALWLNYATALSAKSDTDGANKAFDEALAIEPSNGQFLLTYAAHLARAGRRQDAALKLKDAERLASSDPGLLAAIALEHKAQRDFRACRDVLDRAVTLQDVAELRIYRGACKLALKDLSGATADFRQAVSQDPKSALAHYSLGNALADGGNLNDAVSEWQTCISLGAGTPLAQAAEKKIASLKTKSQPAKRGQGKPNGASTK